MKKDFALKSLLVFSLLTIGFALFVEFILVIDHVIFVKLKEYPI